LSEDEHSVLEEVRGDVREILVALRGDMTDPGAKPGLIARVDRIERPLKLVWGSIIAIVGLIAKEAWGYFSSKH